VNTPKNQAAIEAVQTSLTEHGPSGTGLLIERTGLNKARVQGALKALTAARLIVSRGATANRVHCMAADAGSLPAAAPPPTFATRHRRGKGVREAATRTRAAQAREASSTPAPAALEIVMLDSGCVRVGRGDVAIELASPEEHARLHAFLDRMEPVWREP
jgi:hypothetical protein